MATLRITSTQSSPDTEFRLFADATIDSANRRWKILAYITCINRGTTASFYSGSGTHRGYVDGTLFRTHSGTPFLPSGVSSGGTRWNEGPYTVYVSAPANGQKTIKLRMTMDYGAISYDKSVDLVLPDMGYAAPSVPTGLSGVSNASGGLDIDWNLSSGTVTGYRIAYRVNGTSTWIYTTDTAPKRYLTGLTPGAEYEFRIQAYNDDAASGYSASAYATVKADPPSAPATPGASSASAGAFTATWSAPSSNGGKPITGYDLQYRVGVGSWNLVTGVSSGYTKSGLTAGASVEIQVRAKNADYAGAWSASRTITMKASAPGAPLAPVLDSPSLGTVTVDWAAPASTGGKPITGYDVQYRVNGGSWVTKTNVTSPLTLTGLGFGTVEAQVRAKNADATGSYSATGSLVTVGGAIKVYIGGVAVEKTMKAQVGGAVKGVPVKQYRSGAWVLLGS